MNFKSDDLGDPSLIGLSCESGEFADCDLKEEFEPAPFGCEGVLMFSDNQSTCGSLCDSKRRKRRTSGREGWTKSYISTDTPDGTGDHEHYFYYYGNKKGKTFESARQKLKVYDSNGVAYEDCEKKAIYVRERETHKGWWTSKNSYTLLFSKTTDEKEFGHLENARLQDKSHFTYKLRPDYG